MMIFLIASSHTCLESSNSTNAKAGGRAGVFTSMYLMRPYWVIVERHVCDAVAHAYTKRL